MKILQLILVIMLAWFLFSCSVAKKNQRAVNRVKADINLLNDVGDAWQKLHPCYPDTIRIGKVITVIDSSAGQAAIKDLQDKISEILEGYPDSLKTVIVQQIQKDCKPVTIYKFKTDTLPRDKRIEDALKNQIQEKSIENSRLQGENSQLKLQLKEQTDHSRKQNRNHVFWFIGLGLVIIGSLYFNVRSLFKVVK